MKIMISILLAITVLALCFTACSESPAETKTDVKAVNNTESAVVSQVEQPIPEEEKAEQNSAPVEQQDQTNETSVPTEQPESTPNQSTVTIAPEDIHGDIAINNPTFVSEAALKAWLIQGSGRYEEERGNALQQANNQKFVYYRPSGDLSQYGALTSIEYDTMHQEVVYSYFQNGELAIEVFSYLTDSSWEDLYNNFSAADPKMFKHVTCDNIEYHYYSPKHTTVIWEQFGYTHAAKVYQNKDKIEEIIPLLKLEQVTVNLNSDHVTQ